MTPPCRLILAVILTPLAASHGCAPPAPPPPIAPTLPTTYRTPHATTEKPARAAVLPASAPPASPADDGVGEEETDEQAWQAIGSALGRAGDLKDGVYTFEIPRDDLEVTIRGNDVPTAAGIASEFRFYRCPCGLMNVLGKFVVADYEANDVLDALREGHVEIASVGPLLLHERPRLTLIHFVGENKSGGALAKTLRAALSWTGKERMAPQELDH